MTPQPLFPEPQQLLDWEIDNSPWPMPRGGPFKFAEHDPPGFLERLGAGLAGVLMGMVTL